MHLPSEFVEAWLHLFMSILTCRDSLLETSRKEARKCQQKLEQAWKILFQNYEGKKLEELKAPLPSELVVFFAKTSLKDFTGHHEGILDTYWRYFRMLVMIPPIPFPPAISNHLASFVIFTLGNIHQRSKTQPFPPRKTVIFHRRNRSYPLPHSKTRCNNH